jgi:hypothetical protein
VKWAQAALMDRRTSDRICFRQVRHHDWRGLMSTLEAEKDVKKPVEATEAAEIVDCGRVSERTRGFSWYILFEGGAPPNNKMFPF